MMSTALVGIGYFAYQKFSQANKEGACPVDHTQRQEMVKLAKR